MPENANLQLSDRVVTVPNILSAARLLLVPVFLWLVLSNQNILAVVVLAISSITDYLDGYLARRLNQFSRLGQLLDPLADRLLIFCTLFGLGFTGQAPWWFVLAIVARDVLLIYTIPVLAGLGYGPLPVHFLGKAGTFALLYALPLLLLPSALPLAANFIYPAAWAFAFWGLWLYWWAGYLYVAQVNRLRKSER